MEPIDETCTTVLNVPYNVACDLAEAIAVACVQLRGSDGRLRPVTRNEAAPFLVAAVHAIEEIARRNYSDVLVDLMNPVLVDLPRMQLGKYGWGIWRAGATPEINDSITGERVGSAASQKTEGGS